MSDQGLLHAISESIYLALIVSAPGLVAAVVVGGVVAVLQGATQIQDPVLGFVPKLVAVLGALLFTAAWMGQQLVAYTQSLWQGLSSLSL